MGSVGQFQTKLHVLVLGHLGAALVVVDEDESAMAVGADGPAEGLVVGQGTGHRRRKERMHRGEIGAEVGQESVEQAEGVIGIADLAERAERGLEIVIDLGHVVGIARGLRFLKRAEFSDEVADRPGTCNSPAGWSRSRF